MTHVSATAFIIWSVLSTSLGAFLLGHLWRFDKFKCLQWANSPYNGAFKRIMTYTYLISVPLLMVFSYGFAYIKYKEGWIDIAGIILPKPYTLWLPKYRAAIFPLMLVFSFAWSLEMVTHLEELCFWYFLLTAGPSQPDWFRSPYFRIWAVGSVIAMVFLPVVAGVWRSDPLACEARIYTAGSIGDLVLTLAFIPILWRFPMFIRKVKAEGVDSSIIIRLRKFYELNVVRVICRFLMQLPLLSLGVDGLTPHKHVNESLFWTDLLSTIAALGCVFSSICTLLIFFPRSYEAEYQAKEASHNLSHSSRQTHEPHPSRSVGGRSRSPPTMETDKDSSLFAGDRYGRTDEYEGGYEAGFGKVHGTGNERTGRAGRARVKGKGKRLGLGVNEMISRRLMRLPIPRRKNSGEGAIHKVGIPSLSRGREQEYEMGTGTTSFMRNTSLAGSTGSATTRTDGVSTSIANSNTGLMRKGTYLLTDSPVMRAKALKEAALRGEGTGDEPEVEVEKAVEYALELGLGAAAYTHNNADVDEFSLNVTPSPPSKLPLSPSPPPSAPPVYRTPPTKSSSLSMTSTGRRALPIPPGQADPLGAAPAYYPPEGPETDRGRDRYAKADAEIGSVSAMYGAAEAPGSASALLTTQRPTYTREATDMYAPAQNFGVTIVPGLESPADQPGSRQIASPAASMGTVGLTAANVSRHNDTVLTPVSRTSTLNPLVHTFTSPIDFLVRREPRNGGASGGGVGWAV